MGDGSLVEMTRSEIRADLEAGTGRGAKRAKVPELTQDELDHLLDIYASPARFTAVDIGDEVVMTNDGTGTKHIGNRVQDLQSYEALLGIDIVELWQIDYSYKAIKTNVAHEGQAMKIAQTPAHQPRTVRRDARPGPLLEAGRAHPELVRAPAAGQDRRGPAGAGRGRRDARSTTSSSSPITWSRRAPTASTSTRRARPATPISSPASPRVASCATSTPGWASRSAWPASSCSACTASSSSTASGSPACGPKTSCAWSRRPAPASTGRRSTSTRANRPPGTSRAR